MTTTLPVHPWCTQDPAEMASREQCCARWNSRFSVISMIAIGALSLVALAFSVTMTPFSLGFLGLVILTIFMGIAATALSKNAKDYASRAEIYQKINVELQKLGNDTSLKTNFQSLTDLSQDLSIEDYKHLKARFNAFTNDTNKYHNQLRDESKLSEGLLQREQKKLNDKTITQDLIPTILLTALVWHLIHKDHHCQDTLMTLGKINTQSKSFDLEKSTPLTFDWLIENKDNYSALEQHLFRQDLLA